MYAKPIEDALVRKFVDGKYERDITMYSHEVPDWIETSLEIGYSVVDSTRNSICIEKGSNRLYFYFNV